MDSKALVLGGGGLVGGAWMTGVLAGLGDAGVDPVCADTVIGTSAGAIFGSRLLAGEPARELYERQLAGADPVDLTVSLAQTFRFLWAALGSRDPERSVRRLGRAALKARTVPESAVYDTVGRLLHGVRDWPERALRITAVDALSGRLETFDADSDVTLLEAVGASCAVPVVWPPLTVSGRRWMDGGSRSTANVHLARGHRHVLAIAPVPTAVGPHAGAERQAAALAAEGAHVTLVTPDRAARRAMGRDMTSDARRPAAARAGHAQATALAASVHAAWRVEQ
ncbi:patatin-like phospholipase family protein [Streptomyces sp. SID13726]|uniref:patatin-like phospholipase family protein n=1 Tax=Streptomyces sp. SID13726 TaxID=2706058 RepID=UPI0013B77F18|nr:patatin-like phospholipase family protein [Streptomyces sp. SID13726]NEB00968.1 patatin-like phospholipase family protein [Streptomyces sp. SID13726]